MQGVLLGLLIFSAVFKFVIRLWEFFWGADNSESRQNKEIRNSLIFFTSLGFIMIAVTPSWMMIVLDFDVHPVLWYIFAQRYFQFDFYYNVVYQHLFSLAFIYPLYIWLHSVSVI